MTNLAEFLRSLGGEPDEQAVAALLDRPEPLLEIIAGLLEDSGTDFRWKMLRTRFRTLRVPHEHDPVYVGLRGFERWSTFDMTFEHNFGPRLAKRAPTFRAVFDCLTRNIPRLGKPRIVETGCLRIPGNWELDGQSTFMFDEFVFHHGGSVLSIDLTPESIDSARKACSGRTSLVLNDSVTFLNQLAQISDQQISLLYMDSFDVDPQDWMPSAVHHLKELTAAWPRVGPGTVICIDDYHGGHGKGALVEEFLRSADADVIAEGEQKAWVLR